MTSSENAINYVVTPEIDAVRKLIDTMRNRRKAGFVETNHMIITGESGVGKTSFAKKYIALNPSVETEERRVTPVGYCVVRATGSFNAILKDLLVAIGDPSEGTGARNERDLRVRLGVLVATLRMEILIIDEAQVLLQSTSGAARFRRLELFKDLMSTLGVCIVFMGTPWLEVGFRESSQANERIAYRRHLSQFRISDARSRQHYFRFLEYQASIYGLTLDTDPKTSELGYRIYAYSEGRHRRIVGIMSAACTIANERSEPASIDHWSDAFLMRGDASRKNPFDIPIEQLEIEESASASKLRFDNSSAKPREVAQIARTFRLAKSKTGITITETTRYEP